MVLLRGAFAARQRGQTKNETELAIEMEMEVR
jgi:hypothetical protein